MRLLLPLQDRVGKSGIRERVNALSLALTWEAIFLSNDSVYSNIGLTREQVKGAANSLHDMRVVVAADELFRKATLNATYDTHWSQKQVWLMETALWIQGRREEIPSPSVVA